MHLCTYMQSQKHSQLCSIIATELWTKKIFVLQSFAGHIEFVIVVCLIRIVVCTFF